MHQKEIVIDGNRFSNMKEFYEEMECLLTTDLGWKTGHNLGAFNDLLCSGFGVHDYGESLKISWINSNKSKLDLGYDATITYYENILEHCHQANRGAILEIIELVKQHIGETLMEIIISIILDADNSGHSHTLELL